MGTAAHEAPGAEKRGRRGSEKRVNWDVTGRTITFSVDSPAEYGALSPHESGKNQWENQRH
ncbi:hypothetical protein STRTUCAR8_05350, partial [Streptomyces turgidiscabies Car8]